MPWYRSAFSEIAPTCGWRAVARLGWYGAARGERWSTTVGRVAFRRLADARRAAGSSTHARHIWEAPLSGASGRTVRATGWHHAPSVPGTLASTWRTEGPSSAMRPKSGASYAPLPADVPPSRWNISISSSVVETPRK
eukprot:3076218-Prymnesium_polylepis.1